MQHKMKTLAGATLVAAMSLVGTAQAQQAEQVKIGFAGPMTGAQAHYGTDFQNGDARMQYERLEQILKETLDINPSRETRDLYKLIEAHRR